MLNVSREKTILGAKMPNEQPHETAKRIKGYGFSEYEDGKNANVSRAKKISERSDGVKVKCIPVESLQEFINVIDSLDTSFDKPVFFHGKTNANHLLTPLILYKNLSAEHKHIQEFERRFPKECYNCVSVMEKLVFMQHYTLRTRCFDLSENPLISLYFACKDMVKFRRNEIGDKEKWGEVLVFRDTSPIDDTKNFDDTKNSLSSTTSLIVNTAQMEEKFSLEKLQMFYKNDGHLAFDERYISFRDLVRRSVIVRTPQINDRIKNQQGAFILVNANEFVDDGDDEKLPGGISAYDFTEFVLSDEGKDCNVFNLNKNKYPKYARAFQNIRIGNFTMKKIQPYSDENKHDIFKTDPFDINRLLYCDENNMQIVVLVPPAAKEKILRQLEKLNITEEFVYPEADSIANAINEKLSLNQLEKR